MNTRSPLLLPSERIHLFSQFGRILSKHKFDLLIFSQEIDHDFRRVRQSPRVIGHQYEVKVSFHALLRIEVEEYTARVSV